ncbi:ABC transporter ATP-binding protein [Pontibacillus litoralis]|uniref:ABC transporter n=1 Tax=Pontibacillus litoralis JSM 072002 TaxID=1385512 RepID=A0A0A5G2R8_9BACI|nr:ABC transporter ATP-binding protein [Pontibacillus litoralis]KGX86339.1 ABC transporter [Pontibacillus litoralis JSM 072002]
MIRVNNIDKQFEKEQILRDVTFHVHKGSIYGLLGSNGAGKTTLMRMIAGILKQSNGTIRVEDQNVFENKDIKGRMIFLPDNPYFFAQYSTRQMANFYRDMYPNWDEERYQKLKQVFDLDENKKLSRFSKGMQRQASFWISLSAMPDVFVLDEPFDGLDAVMRKKIKHLIIQDVAEREMTVLISSHNLREVEDLCDHIGILHKGEVLMEKELDDLKADVHKVQVAFTDEQPLPAELDIVYQEKRGSVHLLIVRGKEADISAIMKQHNPVVYDRLALTLEEIFIYEMGGAGYAIENILV